ncbi:MAG: hypothetical protein KJ749_06410, partial [Planctomycetes bacterium]|nr:hypothetical protein [Planctomycetota bacterium]
MPDAVLERWFLHEDDRSTNSVVYDYFAIRVVMKDSDHVLLEDCVIGNALARQIVRSLQSRAICMMSSEEYEAIQKRQQGRLQSWWSAVGGTARRTRRLSCARILHWFAIVIRTSIALVLALAAIITGLAWAANWVFPLAVLQTVGLANRGNLQGVTWNVSYWPSEGYPRISIGVREGSAGLNWYWVNREARGRSLRRFYGGPWPAEIRTENLTTPYKRVVADGSSDEYLSRSMLFLELPLWGLTVVLGAYPTGVLYRGPIRRWRRRRRGLCLKCGYDLRLLTEPRCPECANPFDPDELEANRLPLSVLVLICVGGAMSAFGCSSACNYRGDATSPRVDRGPMAASSVQAGTVLRIVCDTSSDVGPVARDYPGRITWSGGSETFSLRLSRETSDVRLKNVVPIEEPARVSFVVNEDPPFPTKFGRGEWFYRGHLRCHDGTEPDRNRFCVPLSRFRDADSFAEKRAP